MLSELTQRSLLQLWDATIADAQGRLPQEQNVIASRLGARGLARSGVHVGEVDQHAAERLHAVASAMFDQLVEADRSESSSDTEGRIEVLVGLFLERLRTFHHSLQVSTNAVGERLGLLNAAQAALRTQQLDAAQVLALAVWPAKIRLAVTASANAAARGTTMTSNINVHDSSVANIQVGANAVATTTQTVTTSAGVDIGALVAALTVLIEAVSKASSGTPSDRAEIGEMLSELRAEVAKPAPNKRRMAALLSGAADVVKLVPGVAKTWEIVSVHGHELLAHLGGIVG